MKVVAKVVLTDLSNFQDLMLSMVAETSRGWPDGCTYPTTSPFSTVTRTRTVPLIRAVLARAGYEGRSPCTRKGYRGMPFLWPEISEAVTSIAIEITKNAYFIGQPLCSE